MGFQNVLKVVSEIRKYYAQKFSNYFGGQIRLSAGLGRVVGGKEGGGGGGGLKAPDFMVT